jgi:hypothetical protein
MRYRRHATLCLNRRRASPGKLLFQRRNLDSSLLGSTRNVLC